MLVLRPAPTVLLLAFAMACFAPAYARSGDDLLTSQLVDEALQWQQKQRDDLAAPVWRKLLRSVPDHGQALVNLGLIELRAGNLPEANALYARASKLKPAPVGLAGLASALQGSPAQLAGASLNKPALASTAAPASVATAVSPIIIQATPTATPKTASPPVVVPPAATVALPTQEPQLKITRSLASVPPRK